MPGARVDDDGPCLAPPFYALEMFGGKKLIVDSYGRMFLVENRHGAFVDELCTIMNENKERLVKAWRRKSRRTSG